MPDLAKAVRDDLIIGTGRSDFANQVNNVLGFPFIFRGALDVRATKITENMKMAASRALAALAKEPVPEYVAKAHNRTDMAFGREYVIPSPFDKRLMESVSLAVATAAIEDGVARVKDFDLVAYKAHLQELANS
jgi:malate dehydrogenase (oxaloacetate-decarboxylating)(NADP+)